MSQLSDTYQSHRVYVSSI